MKNAQLSSCSTLQSVGWPLIIVGRPLFVGPSLLAGPSSLAKDMIEFQPCWSREIGDSENETYAIFFNFLAKSSFLSKKKNSALKGLVDRHVVFPDNIYSIRSSISKQSGPCSQKKNAALKGLVDRHADFPDNIYSNAGVSKLFAGRATCGEMNICEGRPFSALHRDWGSAVDFSCWLSPGKWHWEPLLNKLLGKN